eukprot:966682-Amphidinium_carterae.1
MLLGLGVAHKACGGLLLRWAEDAHGSPLPLPDFWKQEPVFSCRARAYAAYHGLAAPAEAT